MQDLYPSRHDSVAAFSPRLDPVVHSDWSEDAPISRAQAKRFDRDGYLVLEDLSSISARFRMVSRSMILAISVIRNVG